MAEREIWKPVPGFEGYEVSNLGRVRSVDREVVQTSPWGGFIRRRLRGKILAPGSHPDGHLLVNLSIGNKPHMRRVHCLVLLTFVGEPPAGMEGCHNNGKPTDNRLSNLRYDTPKGNNADKLRHGTHQRGEAQGAARLRREDVRQIRSSNLPGVTLAKQYGVSRGHICNIRRGKSWSWFDGDS